MGDPAQRRQVVLRFTSAGRRSRRTNMVGTMCMWLTLVPVDQPQHVLGLEARLQHDVQAEPRAAHAVGGRRGVVHRAVHQHDDRGIGHEAPVLADLAGRLRLLLGRRRAGGARPWAGRSCPRCRSCCRATAWAAAVLGALRATKASQVSTPAGATALLGRHAVGVADLRRASARPAPSRRRECRSRSGPAGRQWATSTLARAVGQDVARLLRREMPVDRHGIGAELARRHVDLEGREVVAQHQRHAVVLADAERRRSRRRRARHWPGSRPSCGTARPR